MTGMELAAAAERLVGCPFRLHGRDPETGLDCIGVLAAALAATGRAAPLPNGYRLRARRLPELSGFAASCGFTPAQGPCEPGDAVLVRAGPCQFHLAVTVRGGGFVHAHAALGRVVLSDGPLPWPIIHRWRLIAAA